ncbi:Hypothetical predicted protein [Pelobates cultripes]|uniref:DUF4614 domain-containing protein n=1 Tax=Pelobates cultripes TaxID=61616 RepID=A0AAD1S5P8_PELCU|nr:Hypothetical predicted protein [Pelobates cultripes]
MSRGIPRNSVLARAQAQLAGKRVPVKSEDPTDEHQKYIDELHKKTRALKLAQPSFADLSDISADEQITEKYNENEAFHWPAGTQSRFLKKKTLDSNNTLASSNEKALSDRLYPTKSKPLSIADQKRLTETNNRLQIWKSELDVSVNDSDLRTSEDGPFSNRSSSDFSTRGAKFLKKNVNNEQVHKGGLATVNLSTESKKVAFENEKGEPLQTLSSVEASEELEKWWKAAKPARTPSPPSKGTPRRSLRQSPTAPGFNSPRRPLSRFLSRTPSPPSRGTPRFRRTPSLTRLASRSPSLSARSSITNSSPRLRLRRSQTPLSQRSDFKSLDELFSRTEDVSSASSNDFKLNILSLDDLAPAEDKVETSGQNENKITGNAKFIHHLSDDQDRAPSPEAEDSSKKSPSIESSVISEHVHSNLSRSSDPSKEIDDENTIDSVYSEDFEDSVDNLPSESGKISNSESSSKEKSYTGSRQSSSLSSHSRHRKPLHQRKVQKKTVKETAIQTCDSGFPSYWSHAATILEHGPAFTFLEPVSIASHVVRPELIDALSTYNPMALALNDMLKQQLLLTKNFVEMARQQYLSTVSALENERYHYTTLEDTKEYIRQQKSLRQKKRLGVEADRSHPAARQREQ